jgi:altronate dehydratase large subunit
MKLAIRIDARDNVAMAMEAVQRGEMLSVLSDAAREVERVTVAEDVPLAYHKVALTEIGEGDPIFKYGEVIGYATAPIGRGQWVHLHNVESVNYREEAKDGARRTRDKGRRTSDQVWRPGGDHSSSVVAHTDVGRPLSAPEFWGYLRPDGRVGVRNHVLVMATCDCAYEEAKKMAAAIPGAVAVGQFHGCGADPMIVRTMVGIANNPNVGAVLLVGLGCETIGVDLLAAGLEGEPGIRSSGKPLAEVVIQRDGGSLKAIERGTRLLREMASQISGQRRQRFDVSRLFVALQCGGSDGTSGIAANPAVGTAADSLVDAGATVVFSETGEMTGTAHLLARRAVDAGVAARIHAIIDDSIRRGKLAGGDERRLPQGNHDGGLTTIEEKSLGSIRKGGTRPIQGVLEHSPQRMDVPAGPGLYIQDGTGWDVASITHMAALGAQVAVFTTGRGSTTGHAILPVIKVTGTPATYERMPDNMDVNAGRIVLGQAGIADLGAEIYDLLLEVASGRKTKPEALGFEDFQIYRRDRAVERMLGTCT